MNAHLEADAPAAGVRATRVGRMDLVLMLGALTFGLPTLFYPFGGDQGLYYYVGREWLAGAVPYRDFMEQKTPLIFALHALLVCLTGPNMWAIRAAELLWVLGLGRVIADLATPAGTPRPAGLLGFASLATSLFYFGLFSFWDTAQCEIWYVGLGLLSLRTVARGASSQRRWLLGGLFGGLAVVMKPPALLLLPVVLLGLLARVSAHAPRAGRLRARAAAALAYATGVGLPVAATGLYFAWVGGLHDLIDVALLANRHDMIHSASVASAGDVLTKLLEFSDTTGPLAVSVLGLACLGSAMAGWRRDTEALERHARAAVLLAVGTAAVVLQRKFYAYHWGVLPPIMALVLSVHAHDLALRRSGRASAWARQASTPAALAVVLSLGLISTAPGQAYLRHAALTMRHAWGHVPRADFVAAFVAGDSTPYAQHEVVGDWIAAHSQPDDTIAVRGFEQTIYAVANRRAATRFFWTRWLTEPRRAYRRDEWLAQDETALRQHPPRFVVVSERARGGPASEAYFEARGYRRCFRHGRLLVLSRAATPGS